MNAAPSAPPRPQLRDDKLQRLLAQLREAVIQTERDRPNARAQLAKAERSCP